MEEIAKGAEAVLYREGDHLIKEREQKGYRHRELDSRLREERTEMEKRLLEKARQAGVRVPSVEKESTFQLSMEEVDGELLKDVFEDKEEIWSSIGESVARLHNRNVIHGDLTTSNMIVSGEQLYLIDFGLGFFSDRVEDCATDIHLLKETLESTHPEIAEEAMQEIKKAYREESEDGDEVLERLSEIEERGRYK
ncbi:MAG: Kae1-associated serine/threonine protein kinase [Candidatus Nanohaloarchaeota archaeon QJJ-7]|nr:Kae1-associated serine/threonine protein kinase [Candidatus Nanohaloarchaeota archaeon QJJ-7]